VITTFSTRGTVVAAGLLALLFMGSLDRAGADPSAFAVGPSPILNVTIEGGSVTVKSWDRQVVQTESNTTLDVHQYDATTTARSLPREIPVFVGSIQTPRGLVTLPSETFVLSPLGGQAHDAVVIKGTGGETTITIPQSTALIVTRMGRGIVTLDGYHGGTFFVRLRSGSVHLQNMGGEGFVQVLRGPIVADDSSFARLRVRTAQGNMFFERCHVRQIEASSVLGSIAFDNGSFEHGLARFETQAGHVALGIGTGNAQIGAHTTSGRILYNFERRASVEVHPNDVNAGLGRDGAMVTVSSGGNVLLYDGSIGSRGNLGDGWRAMHVMMSRAPAALNAAPRTSLSHSAPRAPRPRRRR